MPRVSVLLTCYNHLRHLPAAVESVRAQTYRDWEIVAIDDASTDGSREWLRENLTDAALVLNEKNLGTYASLNEGLVRARGDLVAILNDDDLWAPTKLERQVALLDAYPEVGLVHTDGGFIDGEGRSLGGAPLGFDFPRTETGDVLLALLYQNKIIASAVLARRALIDDCGGFDPAYFGSGDWAMWLRIAELAQVGYVAEPLTFYRVHGENASHKLERIWRDDQRLREWIAAREPEYRRRGYPPEQLSTALAHNWACLGTVRTLNGDPRGGREAYLRSWRQNPRRLKSLVRWATTFLPRGWFSRTLHPAASDRIESNT
jgi:glycosyltransferase involved in cell wall biosynthesis